MGAGKLRVHRDRAFEIPLCLRCIGRGEPVQMMQSQMVVGPGIQPVHPAMSGCLRFVQRNIHFKRGHQMGNDPGPQIVNPVQRRVKAVAPDHLAVAAVGQL